jgi:glucose/arabinose dehydrogenase
MFPVFYFRSLWLAALLLAGCGGGGGGVPAAAPPPAPAPPPLSLSFTPVASGLSAPVAISHAGDGSNRLFLVQQAGQVRILAAGTLLPTPFIDIADRLTSGGEQGLLGLAFPPGYAQKGYFYLHYSRQGDGATVLSRFLVSADPNLALPASEQVLLTVPQPFANHNGGQLAFGPDGMLYLALGDGGSGGDPQGHGQNPASLLGKLLRLDVEGGAMPYGIPSDNPFVGSLTSRPEIWALGLRNPWRFAFDRQSGDLFIADVGQNAWEEINRQSAGAPGGANYGWNILEGQVCFSPAVGCIPPAAAVAPVAVYDHTLGCSVTGGYVYRGPQNPELQGRYLYGDFCSGRIWGLRQLGTGWENLLLADTDFQLSSFGEDENGRLYLADYGSGTLYRIDQQ